MSRLFLTLTALCLLGGLATAQVENPVPNPEPNPDQGKPASEPSPDEIEAMERRRIEREMGGADAEGMLSFAKSFGIQINPSQHPKRIAPGETGKLVLFVMLPREQVGALPSGSITWAPGQEDLKFLSFGAPSFDPPKAGRSSYADSFVVTVPVTVKPRTEHRSYSFSGTLLLNGSFRSVVESFDDLPAGADGAPGAAGAPPAAPVARSSNKAEIAFTGNLIVGAPVPRPGVLRKAGARRPGVPAASKPATRPAQGGAGAQARAEKPAAAEPAPLGSGDLQFGKEKGSGGSLAPIDSGDSSPAPSSGNLDMILKVAGVLLAFLLLLLILRGKGRA
ncbi:MAG: hypothetical protein CSA62_07450 [Planctomycetota bacterium]|nr:MAG: hypothetical protein CSA62_07450 [Planctomycetota bacterium]